MPECRSPVYSSRDEPVDDPFRSSGPLVTLSSASSALGILNLITNCPNAPPTACPSSRFRFPSFPSRHLGLFFFARDPMKNSRRSIATELLAGRLYLWHSFSWRWRPRTQSVGVHYFSFPLFLFSHRFFISLITYLFCAYLFLTLSILADPNAYL